MTSSPLVLFGLTGDLGKKKLFPALVELARAGKLGGPVIGVGRSEHSDDDLWDMLIDSTDESSLDVKDRLDLSYLVGDSQDPATYASLCERIGDGSTQGGRAGETAAPVVYAALPPDLFGGVARGIGESKLGAATRLVLEKPFGNDSASARTLFDDITSHVPEENVFAVDHFLAKAEVEHLATFRYRNTLIDAGFDRRSVDRIEVTMAEAFGVDGRGDFYESVGAIRDVVQNHLLQMIAVLMMETPDDETAASFDRARAQLLDAMVPLSPSGVILGQFAGYRDLEDVASDSNVETFVAARLAVDNDRWRGVDILLRTGKELESTTTQIVVCLGTNRIRFGVKPDPAVVLELEVAGEMVDLVACGPRGHGSLGDYATMLAGALSGDQRHFAQIHDIVRAWEIVDPILGREVQPSVYEPGSRGPDDAGALLALPSSSLPSSGQPTG